MSSPFAAFVNFVADFTVGTNELIPDRLGNPRPGKATVRVTAVMKALSRRDERTPGTDPRAVLIEGFLVSPLPLPPAIQPECPCTATLNGIPGRFALEPFTPNPYLRSLNVLTVDKIRGLFTPSDAGVLLPVPEPEPKPGP